MRIFNIVFTIILLIILGFIVRVISIFGSDPQDACLDSGVCPEGLQVNVEGKSIIVNEESCKDNGGTWNPDKKVCRFNY